MKRALAALLLATACAGAARAGEPPPDGVLILAHGGTDRWNETVHQVVGEAGVLGPLEIAFGMGMHAGEVEALQAAVSRLEARGVGRIVAVPLLVSSTSEVTRQLEYVLGLRPDGPWPEHAHPVSVRVPVVMAPALDDDPVVAEVLAERAGALSREPAAESVVLVAHGPNEDADNARWLEVLGRVAGRVRELGGFRAVIPVTMRDDAPEAVRDAATRRMRAVVEEQGRAGRVLVVPVLIASGGIEHKIGERLAGLTYAYDGATLLPHPKISQWIARRIDETARRSAVQRSSVPIAPTGSM